MRIVNGPEKSIEPCDITLACASVIKTGGSLKIGGLTVQNFLVHGKVAYAFRALIPVFKLMVA